uniref:Dedicator of cytokinesis C/D N-terminal domain-containing protein n=1 Tax=Poecilia mexicana TaxID=48701 RepID=A0A3B3YN94_9TELE
MVSCKMPCFIVFRSSTRPKFNFAHFLFLHLQQEKPKLIDPLDYEAVISELWEELKEDPLRELLLFPDNDFSVSESFQRRTLNSTVPEGAELQAECLLVRQACKYYNSELNVVQFKYDDYAGDYRLLPRKLYKPEKLPSHSFEIDYEDVDKDENLLAARQRLYQLRHCIKYKFLNYYFKTYFFVFVQSFKRRYFQLTQLTDNSYIMNFYKDEKISKEPKGCIFLDSCTGVVQVGLTKITTQCLQHALYCALHFAGSRRAAQGQLTYCLSGLKTTKYHRRFSTSMLGFRCKQKPG